MTGFVHLRTHTAYSLLEGAIKVKDLVALAKSNNMQAVGIGDTNNMFGALEFATSCAKEGIQPIMGVQVEFFLPSLKNSPDPFPSIFLIAQTEKGYQNLTKLISHAYEDLPNRFRPFVTLEDLEGSAEDVLFLSGGAGGPLGHLVLKNKMAEADRLLKAFSTLFKDRTYIEIQRHGTEEELKTEPYFIKKALDLHLPLVATNNVFFATKNMYEAHDALLCVSGGTYVNETNRRRETEHHYFKSGDEMASLFQDMPEAILNTIQIMKRCSFMPEASEPLLPPFESASGRDEVAELEAQAKAGLIARLNAKENVDPETVKTYEERLAYELGIIVQMGFPGYFLIVSDFIKWAKSKDIPVGPGRGSGAGSLVAWSLLITDIDPIQFGLIFERFLNPERVSMPDFDIDFCQERRDEVIRYVQQRYGSEKVAHIITFGTLQARAVLRDVGRVLQMPYMQVDRICKLVPFNPAAPCTLQEAIDQEPLLQRMYKEEETVTKLVDISLQLEGLYRHASTHAAGVIIGDRPLDTLVPLYRDPKSDILATQFSMKFVEMAGLVKFDFLGLKTLTILKKSVELASASTGKRIDLSQIPLDDEKTFNLLCRLETVGIFQLEGQGMRDVLKRLQPRFFEDIIDINALYRPGPMDSIPRYIACKHGQQEVEYLHPSLEPILKKTHGVMVYQEQVMEIARVLGGYTFGGADLLRRAMGKKIKSEMDAQKEVFTKGAMAKGVDKNIALDIFDQMAKFSGYGFNKSHSAPYALVSYQTAYMKANYPHEFMAATMTYDMHNTDKLEIYNQELKTMGIKLLPPDINASHEVFSVEESTEQKAIRYGLAAVKNVGAQAMSDLVAERMNKGKFTSIQDFLTRMNAKVLNKRQLEHLIMSGAFDTLAPNRGAAFCAIEEMLKYANLMAIERTSLQGGLFGEDQRVDQFELPSLPDWSFTEKLQRECDAIGFYLTSHPLHIYDESFYAEFGLINSSEIHKTQKVIGNLIGLPADLKIKMSKKGRKFAFASFSDAFGTFEVVVFSDMLDQMRTLFERGEALWIKVNIKRDEQGEPRLAIAEAFSLEEKLRHITTSIEVHLESVEEIKQLQAMLDKKNRGGTVIKLIVKQEKGLLEVELPETYELTLDDRVELKRFSKCLVTS